MSPPASPDARKKPHTYTNISEAHLKELLQKKCQPFEPEFHSLSGLIDRGATIVSYHYTKNGTIAVTVNFDDKTQVFDGFSKADLKPILKKAKLKYEEPAPYHHNLTFLECVEKGGKVTSIKETKRSGRFSVKCELDGKVYSYSSVSGEHLKGHELQASEAGEEAEVEEE